MRKILLVWMALLIFCFNLLLPSSLLLFAEGEAPEELVSEEWIWNPLYSPEDEQHPFPWNPFDDWMKKFSEWRIDREGREKYKDFLEGIRKGNQRRREQGGDWLDGGDPVEKYEKDLKSPPIVPQPAGEPEINWEEVDNPSPPEKHYDPQGDFPEPEGPDQLATLAGGRELSSKPYSSSSSEPNQPDNLANTFDEQRRYLNITDLPYYEPRSFPEEPRRPVVYQPKGSMKPKGEVYGPPIPEPEVYGPPIPPGLKPGQKKSPNETKDNADISAPAFHPGEEDPSLDLAPAMAMTSDRIPEEDPSLDFAPTVPSFNEVPYEQNRSGLSSSSDPTDPLNPEGIWWNPDHPESPWNPDNPLSPFNPSNPHSPFRPRLDPFPRTPVDGFDGIPEPDPNDPSVPTTPNPQTSEPWHDDVDESNGESEGPGDFPTPGELGPDQYATTVGPSPYQTAYILAEDLAVLGVANTANPEPEPKQTAYILAEDLAVLGVANRANPKPGPLAMNQETDDNTKSFAAFDAVRQGGIGLLAPGGTTPTAVLDVGPQSRDMNVSTFTVNDSSGAEGHKSDGAQC